MSAQRTLNDNGFKPAVAWGRGNLEERRMRSKRSKLKLMMLTAAALLCANAASAAGYERLTKHIDTVLKVCNPSNSASNTTCKVTSLPGESGYTLIASRSTPLIRNDTTVGTVHEKVWRKSSDSKLHIFGTRVLLNAEASDSSGLSLNVNDVFRRTLPKKRVSIAYFMDGSTKALKEAGRTVQGLNEYDTAQPERDNTWVRFFVDVNAAEQSGPSSASSPWLLTKTRANKGFAVNDFGLRLLSSDFPDPEEIFDLFTSGYQPNGVPPPEEEEEEGPDPT